MARKGYEQHGPLPTIARFREHEVSQLLVICAAVRILSFPFLSFPHVHALGLARAGTCLAWCIPGAAETIGPSETRNVTGPPGRPHGSR